MNADLYPLDWRSLEKGQEIPAETCEKMLGVSRHDKRYGLRLIAARDYIMRARLEEGRPVSVRISKGGLLVMLDSSASEYHAGRAEVGVRQIVRHQRNMVVLVDRSALTAEAQREHDRTVALGAARVQALRGLPG